MVSSIFLDTPQRFSTHSNLSPFSREVVPLEVAPFPPRGEGKRGTTSQGSGLLSPSSSLPKAAQDFESFFVGFLFNTLDHTVDRQNLLYGGFAEDTFRSMMFQELAKEAVQGGRGFGIAPMITHSLS